MRVVKQLALFLENRPGALAAVCAALGQNKINIFALSVSDAVDHAVVRIVVDRPHKAIHLLGEHGVLVVERDVLLITGRNKPGELAKVAKILADHKVNIEYAYSVTTPGATKGALILRLDNLRKGMHILKGH